MILTCTKCKQQKSDTDFFNHKIAGKQAWCKVCQKSANQVNYLAGKVAIEEVKAELGGRCESCALTDSEVLDFDHIDPGTKKFNVADNALRGPKAIRKEAKKCRLLCANCHILHTKDQVKNQVIKTGPKPKKEKQIGKLRICSGCHEIRDLSLYPKDRTQPLGRDYRCKTCTKTRNKNRQTMLRSFVDQFKDKCTDCGVDNRLVLEFDHLRDKEFDLSHIGTLNGVEEEIAKCEVVCRNCHRKRTNRRRKEAGGTYK